MILHILLLYSASCLLGSYHQANDTFLWSDMIVTNEADVHLSESPSTPFQLIEEIQEYHVNMTFDYGTATNHGKLLAINRYPLNMRADSASNYLFNLSQNTISKSTGEFQCTLTLFYELFLPTGFRSQLAISILLAGQDIVQLDDCTESMGINQIGNHTFNTFTNSNFQHICLMMSPYSLSLVDTISIKDINHYIIGSQYLRNNDRLIGFSLKITTGGAGHYESQFRFQFDGPVNNVDDISLSIDNYQLVSQQYSQNKFNEYYTNVSVPTMSPANISGIVLDYYYMETTTLHSYTRAAIGVIDGKTIGDQTVYHLPASTTNTTIQIRLTFSYSRPDEGETAEIEGCATLLLVDDNHVNTAVIMVCSYWSPSRIRPTVLENITVGQNEFQYAEDTDGGLVRYVFISQVDDMVFNQTDIMDFVRVVRAKHTVVDSHKIVAVQVGFKVYRGYGKVEFSQMVFIPSPVDPPPNNTTNNTAADNTTATDTPTNDTSNTTTNSTSEVPANTTNSTASDNTNQTSSGNTTNNSTANTTNTTVDNTATNTTNSSSLTVQPTSPNHLQEANPELQCTFSINQIHQQCMYSYMQSVPFSIVSAIVSMPAAAQLLGLQPAIQNLNYLSYYGFHRSNYDPFLTAFSKLSFNITNSQWVPFFTREALGITNSLSSLNYTGNHFDRNNQPFEVLFKQFILVYVPISIAVFQLIKLLLTKIHSLQQFQSLTFFTTHSSMLLLLFGHNIQSLTFGTVFHLRQQLNHRVNEVRFSIATTMLMVAVVSGVCSYLAMWFLKNNIKWTSYNGHKGYVVATIMTLEGFMSAFCQAYLKEPSQINVCMGLGALSVMIVHIVMRRVYVRTISWMVGASTSLLRLLICLNALFQSSMVNAGQKSSIWLSTGLVGIFILLTSTQILVQSILPLVQHIIKAIKKLNVERKALPVKDRSCLREDMTQVNIEQLENDKKFLKRKIKMMRDLQLQNILKMHNRETGRLTSPRK